MPPQNIRVRIAPSPTGFFHIGTARAALFNWLYARKIGGVFVVRIEDTDTERSKPEYEQIIFNSLTWLGLTWDEGPAWTATDGTQFPERGAYGPYRQSERKALYTTYLTKLVDTELAYWCFCKTDELEAERQSMLAEGIPPKYSGKCRSFTKVDSEKRRTAGESAVIRFKMPREKIAFTDMVRGKVEFDLGLIGDMVIAKSLTEPLFDLANIIDDALMEITHVIRGEDHIPNTPKQIAMARALGFKELTYAHLPLILNTDRSKMSKRLSATALADYQSEGYLPEAFVNFLALLGWHPEPTQDPATGKQHEKEIFSLAELVALFDITRVQKSGAIFNKEKLDWVNNQHIRAMDNEVLLRYITTLTPLPTTGLSTDALCTIVGLLKPRLQKLSEFIDAADFFFSLPDYDAQLLVWKDASKKDILDNLTHAHALLEKTGETDFIRAHLQTVLSDLTKERGNGPVLWPARVALSGKEASPGPFEIMEVLGKTESLRRIQIGIKKLT